MRGYCAVGIDNAKNALNVGNALRAAGCFDTAFVATSGGRYKRVGTDTDKTWRYIPLMQVCDLHEIVPYDCVPVAVDLVEGAQRLETYVHPERAFYVFGAEDQTLGERVLTWCRDSWRRCSPPTTRMTTMRRSPRSQAQHTARLIAWSVLDFCGFLVALACAYELMAWQVGP